MVSVGVVIPAGLGGTALVVLIVIFLVAPKLTSTVLEGWLWILFSLIAISIQWLLVLWTTMRILFDLAAFALINFIAWVSNRLALRSPTSNASQVARLERRLRRATNWSSWIQYAKQIDEKLGKDKWKSEDESEEYDFEVLRNQLEELRKVRAEGPVEELMFFVRTIITRGNCHINNPALYQECYAGTKKLIDQYHNCVLEALKYIAESSVGIEQTLAFFEQVRHSFGKTALCLSGGGSLSMYHFGVVKALMEHGLLPTIISGSSGGSIVAGMLAISTDEELREQVLTKYISTVKGVRWFEPLNMQIYRFLTKGVLMESEFFENAVKAYFGDCTFQEAFARTGRHVNITITASSEFSRGHLVLLNHISSPQVLIRSAVQATCSLPGLMQPVQLLAKDIQGNIVPYMKGGVKFLDGSLRADIPSKRLAQLFNATQYIVSQVNPHIVPFLHPVQTRVNNLSTISHMKYMILLDMKSQLRKLAKLGMIPRIFGQDVSSVVTQKYRGDITILPKLSLVDNFNIIRHPDVDDMTRYLCGGEKFTWPHIWHIKSLMCVEQSLEAIVSRLRENYRPMLIKAPLPVPKEKILCMNCKKVVMNPFHRYDSFESLTDASLGTAGWNIPRLSFTQRPVLEKKVFSDAEEREEDHLETENEDDELI